MSKYIASIYNFLFNSINSIIIIVNGIIMVPLYFHFFPLGVYGAWLATGNMVAMIGLLESGFSGVITQKISVAISQHNESEYRTLVGANLISAIIISSCILLIGLSLSPFVAKIVSVEHGYEKSLTIAFIISLVSSAVQIFVSLFGALPQVWQQTKEVGIINTVANILGIGSMVAYLFLGLGVVSLALGYLTRSSFNLIVQGIWIWRRWDKVKPGNAIYSKSSVINLAKACIAPFLSRIAHVFMGQSTSFVIAAFINPALAAVYDITGKVAVCMMNFLSMANGSFFALFSLTISKGDKHETRTVLSKVTCFVCILIVCALTYSICFTKFVVNYWVGLDKFGGMLLLIAIAVSISINHFKGYFNNLLFSAGKINVSSIVDIICMVVYLGMLALTLSHFGVYAIPLSMGLTNLAFMSWYILKLGKTIEINVNFLFRYVIFSLIFPAPVVALYLILNPAVTNIWLHAIFFIATTIYILIYVCVNEESRHLLKRYVNKVKLSFVKA